MVNGCMALHSGGVYTFLSFYYIYIYIYICIYICIYMGICQKMLHYWLFKIFEIQKGRTFSFNDILRLCTIVVNIAIRIRA